MINRKWISDLVEPRKEGAIFRAYDYLMIVANVLLAAFKATVGLSVVIDHNYSE